LGDGIGLEGVIQTIKSIPGLTVSILEEETKLYQLKTLLRDSKIAREKKDYRKVKSNFYYQSVLIDVSSIYVLKTFHFNLQILFLSEQALKIAIGDTNLKMVKAESLIRLNRFNEALELCT